MSPLIRQIKVRLGKARGVYHAEWDSGSWFDITTMRERGDERESSSAPCLAAIFAISVASPLSLMVSLSNHEPRTTITNPNHVDEKHREIRRRRLFRRRLFIIKPEEATGLAGPERCIDAIGSNQLLMAAAFDDLALVHHHEAIKRRNG